jgi:GT2 family glycosyltransferase
VHVPRILATVPLAARLTPGHAAAAARALAALGLDATVAPHAAAPVLRVSVRPRTHTPVTVIVPTRDRLDLLRPCVDSVLRHRGAHDVRVLVVDNGSVEADTLAAFAQWQATGLVDVLRDDRPFDYAALMNAAVAAARTPLVLLLNNDTEVLSPDWLDQLAGWLDLPDVAAVGAKLYHGDGTIQHAGVLVGVGGVASHGHKNFPRDHAGYHGLLHSVRDVSAATAACLLVRRDAWLQVGGMKSELKVAYNDVDFCLELRVRGHRILWTPLAELHHFEGKSRGKDTRGQSRFEQEITFFQARWAAVVAADPFYNPNLSIRHVDYRPR